MMDPAGRAPGRAFVRVAVSGLLLWLVFRWVDLSDVLARLTDLSPGWVVLGLAISVAQILVLAWRWRFTAARLGIDLPLPTALSEYYLGVLLNQLLPGGVAGDVSRAWRHARIESATGPAVRAVVLERASAQVVMTLTALASVLALPWAPAWTRAAAGATGAVGIAVLVAWLARPRSRGGDSVLGRLWIDAHTAVLGPGALVPQVASAVLVVASYIAVFVAAGRAVGLEAPLSAVLPLVAPVLMTMLVPVSVAGWGVREVAAASLWGLAGMTPAEGAAVSVAYGLLVLVSAAPGLMALLKAPLAGPSRTGRPGRD
jgi:uncharacterized membrane protein YbhN (UPF0104 family)